MAARPQKIVSCLTAAANVKKAWSKDQAFFYVFSYMRSQMLFHLCPRVVATRRLRASGITGLTSPTTAAGPFAPS